MGKDEQDFEDEEEQYILDELKKLNEQLVSSSLSCIVSHPLFLPTIRTIAKPACILVYAYYPQFKKDLVKLFHFEYIEERENGLSWKKSIKSLAEYFGYQVKDENRRWEEIENLFDKKGLKDHFRRSYIKTGERYVKKYSKDYSIWLSLEL